MSTKDFLDMLRKVEALEGSLAKLSDEVKAVNERMESLERLLANLTRSSSKGKAAA